MFFSILAADQLTDSALAFYFLHMKSMSRRGWKNYSFNISQEARKKELLLIFFHFAVSPYFHIFNLLSPKPGHTRGGSGLDAQ